MHASAQTALRGSLEPDVAAVAARHIAGDRQAETDAPGRRIARCIEPDESPKYPLPFGLWNSRPVVVNEEVKPVGDSDPGEPDVAAVAPGVADQITEATPERVWSDRNHVFRLRGDRQGDPLAPHRRSDILEQQRDIGLDRLLGTLTACEVEIPVHHPLHLDNIGFQLLDRRIIAEQLKCELHSGQWRAQIVRYAGEHLCALPDLTPNAIAHPHERQGRLADLGRTLDLEER